MPMGGRGPAGAHFTKALASSWRVPPMSAFDPLPTLALQRHQLISARRKALSRRGEACFVRLACFEGSRRGVPPFLKRFQARDHIALMRVPARYSRERPTHAGTYAGTLRARFDSSQLAPPARSPTHKNRSVTASRMHRSGGIPISATSSLAH